MINKQTSVLKLILISCLVINTVACGILKNLPSSPDEQKSSEIPSSTPNSSSPTPEPWITPTGSMVPPEDIQ